MTPRKYRIDLWVEKKSIATGKGRREIIADLCGVLGIKKFQLYRIRSYRVGEVGALNTDQLQCLADYFDCTADDLLLKPEPVS